MLAYVASAALVQAQGTDYFPLQVGNQWILESESPTRELLNIEVLRGRMQDGKAYFLVSGYAPEQRWIRQADDGTVYSFNEQWGYEDLLAQLRPGAGEYRSLLGVCEQSAEPASQLAAYRGPYLQSAKAVAIQYGRTACRDAGLTEEIYAADIGPVRRSVTTFAGGRTFDLVYARVNGSVILSKAREIVLTYDFNTGSKGWLAGFSDYNLKNSDLRKKAELRALPDEVSGQGSAFYIQSMNRSDDLFMFVKKEVSAEDGLEPNQAYRVSFDIRFASNAPTGCSGVGGSPGDSVYLKAGASVDEPVTSLGENGEVLLSIDKGQQVAGGKDAGVVGTIANGTTCEGSSWPYVRVRKEYAHAEPVRTDERGSFWLVVGTDSGFEGLTGLYLESITVRINPAVEPAAASGGGVLN